MNLHNNSTSGPAMEPALKKMLNDLLNVRPLDETICLINRVCETMANVGCEQKFIVSTKWLAQGLTFMINNDEAPLDSSYPVISPHNIVTSGIGGLLMVSPDQSGWEKFFKINFTNPYNRDSTST